MPRKRKSAGKLRPGGQGGGTQTKVETDLPSDKPTNKTTNKTANKTANKPASTENIMSEIGQAIDRLRKSDLLEDAGHLRTDMRMMRALMRNPVYIPPPFFEESAMQLINLSRIQGADPRVVVGAIKTVAEMVKLNLKVNELAMKEKSSAGSAGPAVHVKVIVNMPEEKAQPKVVENLVVDTSVLANPPVSPVESVPPLLQEPA